jgi:hypothetical protein
VSVCQVHPYWQTPGYEDVLFEVALAPLFETNAKHYYKWIKTKTAEPILNLTWPSHWANYLLVDQYIYIFKQSILKKCNFWGNGDICLVCNLLDCRDAHQCVSYWIVGTLINVQFIALLEHFNVQFIGLLGHAISWIVGTLINVLFNGLLGRLSTFNLLHC